MAHYLKLVERGEKVVICDRNIPKIELKLIEQEELPKRPLGLFEGRWRVEPDAFDPMSVEELDEIYKDGA